MKDAEKKQKEKIKGTHVKHICSKVKPIKTSKETLAHCYNNSLYLTLELLSRCIPLREITMLALDHNT